MNIGSIYELPFLLMQGRALVKKYLPMKDHPLGFMVYPVHAYFLFYNLLNVL